MSKGEVRQRMVVGAARLLAEHGVEGTSFATVLDAVDAPRGSTYHHFPGGKRELVAAALTLAGEHAISVMEPVRGEAAPAVVERFLTLWRGLLTATELRAGCAVVAVTVAAPDADLLDQAGAVFAAWRAQLSELLADGGVPAAGAPGLAALVISSTEGAVALARAERSMEPFELVAEQLMAAARRAMDEQGRAVGLARTATDIVVEFVRPGEASLSGRRLLTLTKLTLSVALIFTNLIGTCVVLALLVIPVVPEPHLSNAGHIRLICAIVAGGYVCVAVPVGWVLGVRSVGDLNAWLAVDRPADRGQIRDVLLAPLRQFAMQFMLWVIAAGIFVGITASYSGELAVRVAIVVVLTGLVTAACAYLAAERLLRSVAARALANGMPERIVVPGVTVRTVLAWLLGTAVPVAGLMSIGILALAHDRTLSVDNLGVAIVVLTGTGILVGLLAMFLAARTIADPISSVKRALGRVEKGDFDSRVPVYDGSQVGQLQLGFNDMVIGLAERERIRAAFGTYVDPDVAARVIAEGTDLAGEQVDVTCMFIDVRGFTPFAEQHPAAEVVATINAMFERVVPVIQRHGGRVDKYVGDGLLAVFGAPRRLESHADAGLAAALEIEGLWDGTGDDELAIGIGLNSGTVVAGNVGGGGRLEFSVIGDTVNVAARVEAATRQTGDTLLISDHTLERLGAEHPDFSEREGVVLKGKSDAVRIYGHRRDG